jgi:hypothetical protein
MTGCAAPWNTTASAGAATTCHPRRDSAVYERGPDGLLAAARVYDDVEPPAEYPCAGTGELGFDAAIDYKPQDVGRALREHVPGGVDTFFDNVGGEILDAALTRLVRGARIVLSDGVSQAAQQTRSSLNLPGADRRRSRVDDRVHHPCPGCSPSRTSAS